MEKPLNIISSDYYETYSKKQLISLQKHFSKLQKIEKSEPNIDFYLSGSAVYSSLIEGNPIDFDSYLKYHHSGMNRRGKSYREIEDLKKAYSWAKKQKLTFSAFLKAHQKLSRSIIKESNYRGVVRDKGVYVYNQGIKVYSGPSAEILPELLKQLFSDIDFLLKQSLSIEQVFYYAAMIHLVMVQIHPFADGNGRASRLLEKWFLASKLGSDAWFLQSERLYQKRLKSYYKNVNIGSDYSSINYDLALPFLLMLPMSLRIK